MNRLEAGSDFVYTPPKEENPFDVVVAKPSGTDQIIAGSKERVADVLKAFNLLDNLGFGYMRNMSVLVLPAYRMSELGDQFSNVQVFSTSVLERFGVIDKIKGSIYNQFDLQEIGVFTDVRNPVHVTCDYSRYLNSPQSYFWVLYAAEFVHEWQHVLQFRSDLPKYSLWSERHAMKREATILLRVLNTNQILPKEDEEIILSRIAYLAQSVYEYRNGRGFEGHLDEKEMEGTPQKQQTLYED